MKTTIIFSEGVKQINLIPETDDERMALSFFTPNDNIDLAVRSGSFGEAKFKPFTVSFKECVGKYIRTYDSSVGIMLILSPKENIPTSEETHKDSEQLADEFTTKKLKIAGSLLSDDYIIGFKEGVEKYIDEIKNVKHL